jgi:hypothetical protein
MQRATHQPKPSRVNMIGQGWAFMGTSNNAGFDA